MIGMLIAVVVTQHNYCPAGNISNPGTCVLSGDPVDLNYGGYLLTRTDAVIPGQARELAFVRQFASNSETWAYNAGEGTVGMPKPFGDSSFSHVVGWWHNWFSFIEVDRNGRALLRDRTGRGTDWVNCVGGQLQPGAFNTADDFWISCPLPSGGYRVVDSSGDVLIYEDKYQPPNSDTVIYFLSSLEDETGNTVVRLHYEQPVGRDERPIPNCLRPDSSTWAPYLAYVQDTTTWATLRLVYRAETVEGQQRCSIATLEQGFGTLGVNVALTPIKEYAYRVAGQGVGNLKQVMRNTGQLVELEEEYVYATVPSTCIPQVGVPCPPPQLNFGIVRPDGKKHTSITFDYAAGSNLVQYAAVQDLQKISYSFSAGTGSSTVHAAFWYDDGNDPVRENYVLVDSPSTHSGRLNGADVLPASYPYVGYDDGYVNAGSQRVLDWNVVGGERIRQVSAPNGSGWLQVLVGQTGAAVASVQIGVDSSASSAWPTPLSSPGNCAGLECTWFQHVPGGAGGLKVESTVEASTVSTGQETETRTSFYSNGQVSSVIKHGWTLDSAGAIVERYIGTFYRHASTYGGGGCDIFNSSSDRVVEEEGPCFVSGFGAIACDTPGRLVQYHYPVNNFGSPDNGRVTYRREFPSGCYGQVLETSYSDYTVQGQPRYVVSAAGVTTRYEYDNLGRILSRTVLGPPTPPTWYYGYTNDNKLSYTLDPDGQYVVYCYTDLKTTGAPPEKCEVTGLQRERPVWVAYAASPDGAGWTRARVDDWRTTRLVSSSFFRADGTLDYVESSMFDADSHLARTARGGGAGSGAKFDVQGNRIRLGVAENLPSIHCTGTNGLPDPACDQFYYDRASRLTQFQQDLPGSLIVNTFIEYDAVGNVCEVELTGQSSPNSKKGCQLDSPHSGGYTYDDFGNIVRVSLQNTMNEQWNKKGVEIREYDAAGNLVAKITPVQQAGISGRYDYSRDMSGRLLSVSESQLLPPPFGQIVVSLYEYQYDSAVLPQSCSPLSNVVGELAAVSWPGGVTYYYYDSERRVTSELTLAPGQTSCAYEFRVDMQYTPGGRLQQIRKGDRVVFYSYIPGADADLVEEVYLRRAHGNDVYSFDKVVDDIEWNAHGELRSYWLNLLESGDWKKVVYTRDTGGRLTDTEVDGVFNQSYSYVEPVLGVTTNQLRRTCTSYLGSNELCQDYDFDRVQRLTSYSSEEVNGLGIVDPKTTWQWDARGNLVEVDYSVGKLTSTFGSQFVWTPDWVTREAVTDSTVQPSLLATDVEYDSSGRVQQFVWAGDSSGNNSKLSLGYDGNSSAIGDSAIRNVTVGGFAYQYVYDAAQRRRTKVFPAGGTVDFWYSPRHSTELLYEREHTRADEVQVDDFYVWLGGRVVAIQRGAFNEKELRQSDSELSCGRSGEVADTPCGIKYVVSDDLPKPVLALDGAGRIAGVAEYSPFGEVNTRQLLRETEHPYAEASNYELARWNAPSMGLLHMWRFNFDVFDTEENVDQLSLKNEVDATLGVMSGHHLGHHTSSRILGWNQGPAEVLKLVFDAKGDNCPPNQSGCSSGSWPYTGVAVRSAEFVRYQEGAYPYFPFLRFPGQYYDEETGLSENWNRFYRVSRGRYQSLEPLLANPRFVASQAVHGVEVGSYVYGRDNPLMFVDGDGYWATDSATATCMRSPELCQVLIGGAAAGVAAVSGAIGGMVSSISGDGTSNPPDVCVLKRGGDDRDDGDPPRGGGRKRRKGPGDRKPSYGRCLDRCAMVSVELMEEFCDYMIDAHMSWQQVRWCESAAVQLRDSEASIQFCQNMCGLIFP